MWSHDGYPKGGNWRVERTDLSKRHASLTSWIFEQKQYSWVHSTNKLSSDWRGRKVKGVQHKDSRARKSVKGMELVVLNVEKWEGKCWLATLRCSSASRTA